MLKHAEISEPNSCLNNAKDDEPIFVLKSTDELAPSIVRTWAIMYFKQKSETQPMGLTPKQRAKHEEAMTLAVQMERWHAAYVAELGSIPQKSHPLMPHDHGAATINDQPLSAARIVERLCRLQAQIYEALNDPGCADCFCMTAGFWGTDNYGGTYEQGYRNDGRCIEFIEAAVREKIEREKVTT